jgi:hypothetical protein
MSALKPYCNLQALQITLQQWHDIGLQTIPDTYDLCSLVKQCR